MRMKAASKVAASVATAAMALGMTAAANGAASASTGPVAASGPAAVSPTRHTVALEPCGSASGVCWMDLERHFGIDEGPALWVPNARWSSWGRDSAYGSGTLWGADVQTTRIGHATFYLYRPRGSLVINGKRHPYFTRLHLTGGHNEVAHWWHWSWAAHCWQ